MVLVHLNRRGKSPLEFWVPMHWVIPERRLGELVGKLGKLTVSTVSVLRAIPLWSSRTILDVVWCPDTKRAARFFDSFGADHQHGVCILAKCCLALVSKGGGKDLVPIVTGLMQTIGKDAMTKVLTLLLPNIFSNKTLQSASVVTLDGDPQLRNAFRASVAEGVFHESFRIRAGSYHG